MKSKSRWIIMGIMVVGLTGAVWFWTRNPNQDAQYRVVKIERGDIHITVLATGTVQPITQVQVGTQVTGTITGLFADFNSHVTAGQVIAQIDPALFQARVEQDRANLLQANANVEKTQATLVQAEKELARSEELARRELISPSELDAAVASFDSLAAQLKVSNASVVQNEALLKTSQINLKYTTILSPIDGVVVSRNVDVGQTVAASLSAPTLFVIANTLKHVQCQANIAEADIGKISLDQKVSFTVDAYPEDRFHGKISQIRLSPVIVQNVVTYTVIVKAENPEEKLLPGMTANMIFEVDEKKKVLKIPNTALRFTPPGETAGKTSSSPNGEKERGHEKWTRVWIQTEDGTKSVPVATGVTDGTFTQIVKGELQEGQDVIIGIVYDGGSPASTQNPFMSPGGGSGGRGGWRR